MLRATPLLAAIALAFAACAESEAPPSAAGGALLWRVTGPGGDGWLLGTMHVGEPRAVALRPAAEAAFGDAGAVYTEIAGGIAAAAKLQEAGTLPPGRRLQEVVPPEVHRRLAGHLQAMRMQMDLFERFRPWMATLMLGQLQAMELLSHGPPLDEVLRARASEAGKLVGAVETIEEQIAALAAGSEEQHVRLLDLALAKLEEDRASGRNRLQELFEVWLRGDEAALERLQREEVDLSDPAQRVWWDAVFIERNRRMAERVDVILRAAPAQRPLFAFGALHFVGADSVVERLRELGWTVERVP